MERDFADLYGTRIGQASWYRTLSDEASQWLHDLADYIDEKDREPTWSAVADRFGELFPDHAPKATGTIIATVRRLRG